MSEKEKETEGQHKEEAAGGSRWPAILMATLVVGIIAGSIVFSLTLTPACADGVSDNTGNDINTVAPPAKTAKAPARTPAPEPVSPTPTPDGNVTGVIDQPLEAVNVNATACKTRVTLTEQGGKVLLRTTYSCPPTAVNIVTGNE
ncbi:MAG: hypothetical protein U9Q03_01785 [Patescibacteria group bacterium]|nr:hypothetical protein [Patescibacteria group bacterium]